MSAIPTASGLPIAGGDPRAMYLDMTHLPPSIPESASAVNTPSIVTSAGDVLTANPNRKAWSVQNLGTNVLYVRMGTGASATHFHFLLKGCALQDDGSGGFVSDDLCQDVISIAGMSPRCVVSEES